MTEEKNSKPTKTEGGCLCGKVRYTIDFSPTHPWDNCIGTCQCSWCRKVTGSLLFRYHQCLKAEVTFNSRETLKNYQATPDCNRGFCCECGSYLYFMRTNSKYINFAVGCFDTEYLKRWGPDLTLQGANLWVKDEIKGVTDHLTGERFETEPES